MDKQASPHLLPPPPLDPDEEDLRIFMAEKVMVGMEDGVETPIIIYLVSSDEAALEIPAGLASGLCPSIDVNKINFNSYNVLVLAQVLKSFLWDMSEPLLTFKLHDEFLRATEFADSHDKLQSLKSSIRKLPMENHNILEKIHLPFGLASL